VLSLDNFLSCPIIAHRLARQRDTAREGGFTHYLPRPDVVQQFIFGHNMVMVLEQIGEHLEDFGFDLDPCAMAGEAILRRIEFIVRELVLHKNG
jgi:hypothetical protein